MAKPNAYSMFVKHICRQRQTQGIDTNMASLFQELGPVWQSMSDSEKQIFKDQAKMAAEGVWPKYSRPIKTETSHHVDDKKNVLGQQQLGQDEPEVKLEVVEKKIDMRVSVKREHSFGRLPDKRFKPNALKPPYKFFYKHLPLLEVRRRCEAVVSSRATTFIEDPMYSCSTNVLCKTKKDNKRIYIPLEVALYAYSIQEGKLGPPYHVMINSGDIPPSYVNKAHDHAANHKITIPYCQDNYPPCARSDYRQIYKEMLDYAKDGERVIVVKEPDDLDQTEGCLEWLIEKANEGLDSQKLPGMSAWTVVTAVDLFAAMYYHVEMNILHRPEPKFALHYYIQHIYDAGVFDHNDAIMCKYHQKENNTTKWCAQSCAIRLFNNLEGILEEIYDMYNMSLVKNEKPADFTNVLPNSEQGNARPELSEPPKSTFPAALPSTEAVTLDALPETGDMLAIEGSQSQTDVQAEQMSRVDSVPTGAEQEDEEPLTCNEAPVRPPKKKEEPLIIPSGPNGFVEYPPDVY